MSMGRAEQSTDHAQQSRVELVDRLRRLEEDLSQAQEELARLGGQALPGLHLVVEAAGRRGLLSASRVQEVVRLVAFEPIPEAPPSLLGTFVWRGVPAVAVDLATLLGAPRRPSLDAQIVVLAGSPTVGMVLDRVHGLHVRPVLHASSEAPDAWKDSRLVSGLCTVDGEVLPLLDPGPLISAVRETVA